VLEQAANLTQDLFITIRQVVVDLGFKWVDADNPGKEIIHRGKFKNLGPQQRGWLLRAVARLGIGPAFLFLLQTVLSAANELRAVQDPRGPTPAVA